MHLKSNNLEIMICNKTDEFTQEFSRYQTGLEQNQWKILILSLTFDFWVNFMHSKYDKINLRRAGSYIDSPAWIKNKKAIINPINNDDKCFQYITTVALSHEEIGKNCKLYQKWSLLWINYNWEGINYPPGKNDWKKFVKNNPAIYILTTFQNTI